MTEDQRGRHDAGEPLDKQGVPLDEQGVPLDEQGAPLGFWDDLKDAVAPRTVLIVIGVLLLQLAFILSYVGAFHRPTPHRISIAVVAPAQASAQLVGQLNALPGEPVRASAVAVESTARRQLSRAETSAVLLSDPTGGTSDTLLVTSAGGTSVQTAVQEVISRVEASQKRSVTIHDVIPLQPGDGRGLTGFYLVIGWIVGGYLVAALLGVAKGSRPATPRRALFRLGAVVPYAIVSGIGGTVIVGPVLGAMTGHLIVLWWLGALLVFAAAAVTMAFQVFFGVIGIGLTVLLFVVLGNPSAGGAYQPGVLPPFWRALSGALPNGAGTDSVRRIVYFHSAGLTRPIVVIAAYALIGALLTYGGSWRDVAGSRRSGSGAD
ncbi:MAG: hypothetical protein JWN95_89 [Frankiales bacterium]|nr:hypothetical protein [Frankiales bacterium]